MENNERRSAHHRAKEREYRACAEAFKFDSVYDGDDARRQHFIDTYNKWADEHAAMAGPASAAGVTDADVEAVKVLARLARHADTCMSHLPLPTGDGQWHCDCGLDHYVLDGEPTDACYTALAAAAVPAGLSFSTVDAVVKALSRIGHAFPESQEEQAARFESLVLDLCREVQSHFDAQPAPADVARDAVLRNWLQANATRKTVSRGDSGRYPCGESWGHVYQTTIVEFDAAAFDAAMAAKRGVQS